MTPSRLTSARQLAGLSIVQATKLLGWSRTQPLLDLESGDAAPPSIEILRQLAELYGVSLVWLRGQDVELPESTHRVLRLVEHPGDRARLTELLTAIQGGWR